MKRLLRFSLWSPGKNMFRKLTCDFEIYVYMCVQHYMVPGRRHSGEVLLWGPLCEGIAFASVDNWVRTSNQSISHPWPCGETAFAQAR